MISSSCTVTSLLQFGGGSWWRSKYFRPIPVFLFSSHYVPSSRTRFHRVAQKIEWAVPRESRAQAGSVQTLGEMQSLIATDGSGISVYATNEVAPESTLISCPFEVAITPSLARRKINALYAGNEEIVDGWSERMLVATYLALHWIQAGKSSSTDA